MLAGLARGKLRAKHGALAEALAGRFDDHHAELARMLLDQIDALGGQIGMLTTRIEELLAAIPAAHGVDADGTTGPGAGSGPDAVVLPAVARLDEVSGIGPAPPRSSSPRSGWTWGLPDSWASGVVGQAEPPHPPVRGHPPRRQDRQGQPYLKGVLGEAAAAAAKTDTFLGERYRRLVKRRGKLKALVAIARSILVIVWHLLADLTARYHDLGAAGHQPHRQGQEGPQPHPAAASSCSPSPLPQQQPDPSSNTSLPKAGFAGCCRLPSQG